MKRFTVYSLVLILSFFVVYGYSATISSNGTGGGAWNVGSTWNGGVVPANTDDVIIVAGDRVTVGAAATCASLTIQSDGSQPLDGSVAIGNFTLTVTGDLNLTSTGGLGDGATFGSPTITLSNNASSVLTVGGNINFNLDDGYEYPTLTLLAASKLNIAGNFNIADVDPLLYSSNYNISFGGTNPTGTVTYNGTGTQTVIGGINYGNLTLSGGAGTKVLDPVNPITIKRIFTPNTGSGLSYTTTNSSIIFNNTIAQTIPAFDYNDLTISGSRGATSVTLANGGTIKVAGNYTISGLSFTTGAFITTNNTFIFNGSNAQTIPFVSGKLTYNNLTTQNSSGSGAILGAAVTTTNLSGNITVTSGKLSNGGFAIALNNSKIFTVSAGATFTMTGTTGMPSGTSITYTLNSTSTVDFAGGAQTVMSGITYGNLTFSASGTKTFASGTTSIAGTFSVTAGTPDATTNSTTIDFNGAGQTISGGVTFYNLTLSNSGTKTFGSGTTAITNSFTISGTASADFTTNSVTTDFSGAGQTIPAATYYNLTLSNSGTKTFASGTTTLKNSLSVTGSATPDFSSNSSTLDFNGTTQTVPSGITYYNLTLSNSGTKTFSSGTTTIKGAYSITGTATADHTTNSGTVDFNGTTQTVPAITFHHLTISNSGTKTFSSGTTTIKGNYVSSGTAAADFSSNSSTALFNGSSSQTISGGTTWYNLTISNSSGVSISSGTQNISNTLTLTSGVFTTTGQTLILLSNATRTANISVGSGSITGNITAQRCVTGSAGYRYIGAPVSCNISELQPDIRLDGMTGVLFPGRSTYWCNVYNYNESTTGVFANGWTAETSVNNALTIGRGYALYMYSENTFPVTLDFVGTPNSGTISLPVSYRNNGDADQGWNLVANPYPSAIDWDDPGDNSKWVKTNISGSAYVWDNSLAPADYVVKTAGSGYQIASGQAFFVKATGSSPVLTVKNAARASASPTFYKTQNSISGIDLKLSGKSFLAPTSIRFITDATNGFDDKYDGYDLGVKYFSSINATNDTLSLNSLPIPDKSLSIPLTLSVPNNGTYSISADNIDFSVVNSLVLEDLITGDIYDLTSGSYQFTTNSVSVPVNRFILHVNEEPLSIKKLRSSVLTGINTYVSGKSLSVELNVPVNTTDEVDINIYNMVGQKVFERNHINAQDHKIAIDLSGNIGGLYILQVNSRGGLFSKKFNIN